MRKIINGRKYDTDTAQELGYYSNYGSWNDFNHFEETLSSWKDSRGKAFVIVFLVASVSRLALPGDLFYL